VQITTQPGQLRQHAYTMYVHTALTLELQRPVIFL